MAKKYKDTCKCGGQLYVVAFKAECGIILSSNGYDIADTNCFEGSDEVVQCCECEESWPLSELEIPND